MIITIWEVSRMLSSSVEYLLARLYNSSIVVGGSKDNKWKNSVVGPKLLRKFWRTVSILYKSICWTTPPNLLVKSLMDSSSRLKMVCRELMFPFSRTEHRYWEKCRPQLTKQVDKSLREFVEPSQGGPLQAGQEHFS